MTPSLTPERCAGIGRRVVAGDVAGAVSGYRIDIETTGGDHPPDTPVPLGMGCASSTVWCRVTRGDESTGWVECRGVTSIIKARAGFNAALATYGDVGEDVGAMFEAVTGVAMVLS